MQVEYRHPDLSIDQQLALRTAATNLAREFDGTFGAETIDRFLHSSYDEFAGRAVVWTDEVVRAADVVITMGCGDACPVFPGRRYEDWVLDDPAGLDLDSVRPIRDEIERRVRRLLADLEVPHVPDSRIRFARTAPLGTSCRRRRLSPNTGVLMTTTPSVLFVCVHNAGRSQMAAALLNHYAAGRVDVRSAGSAPAEQINPAVREAMTEIGIDISAERPKLLTTDAVEASDVVITMGCGDACPVFPGKRYLDWQLTDPAGKGVDAVRPIRDEIDTRVRGLLDELGVAPAEGATR
jgi:arsenate reductase (thioredoxin)